METHTQRFSETPPGSPKSCMKGSRRLNFEDESSSPSGSSTATTSSSSTRHHHHHHHHREHHQHSGESSSSKKTHSVSHQSDAPPQSPSTKRSGKTVMIRSPGSEHSTTSTGVGTSSMSTQCATEIPFQFHLSQHYDNPDPPPNCTSNGAYEEERLKKLSQHNTSPTSDSSDQSSSSNAVVSQSPQKPESLYNNHADKLAQYDPQLVAIASKFVNEIMQKAALEVASKQQTASSEIGKRGSTASTSTGEHRHRGMLPLLRRAQGVISKWVTNICVRAQNAMKT